MLAALEDCRINTCSGRPVDYIISSIFPGDDTGILQGETLFIHSEGRTTLSFWPPGNFKGHGQWQLGFSVADAVLYPGRWINYRTGAVVLIAQEQWPPKAFILCLTNDLIWWIPFGLYLYDAWKPFIADVEDLHTNT